MFFKKNFHRIFLLYPVGVPGDVTLGPNGSNYPVFRFHFCCELIAYRCMGLNDLHALELLKDWPVTATEWINKFAKMKVINPNLAKALKRAIGGKELQEIPKFTLLDRLYVYTNSKNLKKAEKDCRCLKNLVTAGHTNYELWKLEFEMNYNRYFNK